VRAGATTTTDLAARALAFDHAVFARSVDRVEHGARASVIATPSLPRVPHLQAVLLHAPMDAGEAEALAEDRQQALGFRRLLSLDGALAEALVARGWRDEPLVILGRDGTLEPPAADVLAEEVPYGHVRGLRNEWICSQPWATGEQEVRNAEDADARMLAGTPTRAFAAFEQGRPLAYALLIDGGRDGMLEDVYTTPSARGRGLATGVIAAVLHAARAERHEYVYVPTAADGRARALYERLGFEPLVIQHQLIKSDPSGP
jgi:GNAT superfamily N-acetyltransferase